MTDRCRILTRQGAQYVTEQDAADIAFRAFESDDPTLIVQTVVGCELFPAEWLTIRTDEIVAVQSMSDENWAFSVQAETDHYRRILEATPQEQMAESQRELIEVLKGGGDDD